MITLVLVYLTPWLVQKIRTTLSTNRIPNVSKPWLFHWFFTRLLVCSLTPTPHHPSSCDILSFVLIGHRSYTSLCFTTLNPNSPITFLWRIRWSSVDIVMSIEACWGEMFTLSDKAKYSLLFQDHLVKGSAENIISCSLGMINVLPSYVVYMCKAFVFKFALMRRLLIEHLMWSVESNRWQKWCIAHK